jgi:signal transduction histidine kinase
MSTTRSLTGRLIVTVLLVEFAAAAILAGAAVAHERHIRLAALDVMLRGRADTLLGAVQDADDEADDVMLDTTGLSIPRDDIFHVEDEKRRVLGDSGSKGAATAAAALPDGQQIGVTKIEGRHYRVLRLHGIRIVDPGKPGGGIRRAVTILYGVRMDRVWHEVLEAVRFSVIATLGLLGVTALVMVWLVRRGLTPLHEFAAQAERISLREGRFETPASAKQTEELIPLAEAIESALARLKQSLDQQRRLTSDAAHELKTDLAIAKSSLQLLTMRTRTVEEYQQGLELCLDDYTRLERTVQEMLTLARVEHGDKIDRNSSASCDLCECVEESIRQSRQFSELRQIKVRFSPELGLIAAIEERDCLLVCSNLLLNALQHSPPQTIVEIDIAREGDDVLLWLRDRGEGIAEEDLPHIFEPFYRGDPSRNRKSGGTGLGLAISKAICERAGGSIQVANRPGAGVEAIVRIPLAVSKRTETSGELKPTLRD